MDSFHLRVCKFWYFFFSTFEMFQKGKEPFPRVAKKMTPRLISFNNKFFFNCSIKKDHLHLINTMPVLHPSTTKKIPVCHHYFNMRWYSFVFVKRRFFRHTCICSIMNNICERFHDSTTFNSLGSSQLKFSSETFC